MTGSIHSQTKYLVCDCYYQLIDNINTATGKIVSCGAVILYCLNLLPEERFLSENVFIVGLIPPPLAPDTTTISHMVDPVVSTMLEFLPPGKLVPTHYHPEGVHVQTRIMPLIADLEAF